MNENRRSIYDAVVERYGAEAQLRMAMEKCSELTVAICHYLRGRIPARRVAEEVADVQIMMEQLYALLGAELVDVEKDQKLKWLSAQVSAMAPGRVKVRSAGSSWIVDYSDGKGGVSFAAIKPDERTALRVALQVYYSFGATEIEVDGEVAPIKNVIQRHGVLDEERYK